jgi:hypothetical protein
VKHARAPLALAAAACTLAAAAGSASADKAPVPGLPSTLQPPAGKGAPAATPALAGRLPRHYTVVRSAMLAAGAGVQTRGTVSCPAGTVVFGGGALIFGNHLDINLNSSFPSGDGNGWLADVNNAGAATGLFLVQAVCGKAPRRYQIVASTSFSVNAGSQATGSVACPRGTAVLGGGSLSGSGSLAVNINSTFPQFNGWRTDQNDNAAFATTFGVLAICGKAPRSYTIVVGTEQPNPPSMQSNAIAECPAGELPLGGGAISGTGSPTVDLNTSIASDDKWSVFEDNTGQDTGVTIQAYAICA